MEPIALNIAKSVGGTVLSFLLNFTRDKIVDKIENQDIRNLIIGELREINEKLQTILNEPLQSALKSLNRAMFAENMENSKKEFEHAQHKADKAHAYSKTFDQFYLVAVIRIFCSYARGERKWIMGEFNDFIESKPCKQLFKRITEERHNRDKMISQVSAIIALACVPPLSYITLAVLIRQEQDNNNLKRYGYYFENISTNWNDCTIPTKAFLPIQSCSFPINNRLFLYNLDTTSEYLIKLSKLIVTVYELTQEEKLKDFNLSEDLKWVWDPYELDESLISDQIKRTTNIVIPSSPQAEFKQVISFNLSDIIYKRQLIDDYEKKKSNK